VPDAAAAYLGVSEHQVRDNIRTGRLTAQRAARHDQVGTRYIVDFHTVSEVAADSTGSEVAALADELGVAYDAVRRLIVRHEKLELRRADGRRNGTIPKETVDVREHFAEQDALRARAVRLTDVASEMGVSVASINTMIRRGDLIEDIRFHGGYRSLTKDSVEALEVRLRRRRRPQRAAPC
jgi:hypothetical protein